MYQGTNGTIQCMVAHFASKILSSKGASPGRPCPALYRRSLPTGSKIVRARAPRTGSLLDLTSLLMYSLHPHRYAGRGPCTHAAPRWAEEHCREGTLFAFYANFPCSPFVSTEIIRPYSTAGAGAARRPSHFKDEYDRRAPGDEVQHWGNGA